MEKQNLKLQTPVVGDSVFKISLFVGQKGIKWFETEWKCKGINKVYTMTRVDEDGEKVTRRLNKEDFNKINRVRLDTNGIEYNIVCTHEQKEDAKKLLIDTIKGRVLEMQEEIMALADIMAVEF